MAGLRLDPHLHAIGETVEVPHPFARAAAWWVAAELIRRHPNQLTVIETHPGGGLYDCRSIYRLDRQPHDALVVHLNVDGHLTHGSWFGEEDKEGENRFNWFEVIATPNRRAYVIEQLERVAGLSSPEATPRTARRSIGPLLIANIASSLCVGHDGWDIRNAFYDTSGGWSGITEWSRSFPGIDLQPQPGDFADQPAYRYWAVLGLSETPMAVIDINHGVAWRHDGTGPLDLPALYSSRQRRFDRLAALVLPELEHRS